MLRRRAPWLVVPVLAVVAVQAALCAAAPASPAAVSPSPTVPLDLAASSSGPHRGTIVWGWPEDAQRLDPVTAADPASATAIQKLYDPLVSIDAKTGEARPALASWTVSTDGLVYHWTIAKAARWSDGAPVVARDWLTRVKLQARSKITASKGVLSPIEGYDAYASGAATEISGIVLGSDQRAFDVRLTRAWCPALTEVFGTAPLPAQVFGKYVNDRDLSVVIDDAPEASAPPVVSGPFSFGEWKRGESLTLERNPLYWREPALVDRLVFRRIEDPDEMAELLSAGELSAALVRPEDVKALEAEKGLKLYRWRSDTYTAIAWREDSTATPFLAEPAVRRALAYGLDVEAIVGRALAGEGVRVVAHQPAGSWAAAAPASLDQYEYDPAKAEGLLLEVGFTRGADGIYARDGRRLVIRVATNSESALRTIFLDLATDQYSRIGVGIEPVVERFTELVAQLTGRSPDIDAAIVGLVRGSDPDAFALWHSTATPPAGTNFAAFHDERVDALLDRARSGPDCAQAARAPLYQEVDQILNAKAPFAFGLSPLSILAVDARLTGADPGTFDRSGSWNVGSWKFN